MNPSNQVTANMELSHETLRKNRSLNQHKTIIPKAIQQTTKMVAWFIKVSDRYSGTFIIKRTRHSA